MIHVADNLIETEIVLNEFKEHHQRVGFHKAQEIIGAEIKKAYEDRMNNDISSDMVDRARGFNEGLKAALNIVHSIYKL